MRSIRNFFHNINDVLLAIIIVAVAAGIIYWRMQIILDYPDQVVKERAEHIQDGEVENGEAEPDAAAEEDKGETEAADEASDGDAEPQGARYIEDVNVAV